MSWVGVWQGNWQGGWMGPSDSPYVQQGLPPTYGEPGAIACSYDGPERRIRIVFVGADRVPQTLLDADVKDPGEVLEVDRLTLMALGLTNTSGYASGALHRVVYYDNQSNDITTLGLLAQNAYNPYN